MPSPPNLELSDEILNVLDNAENVLKTDYVSEKTLNEKDIEEIKNKYNFDDIKNELDDSNVPSFLESFYGGEIENFRVNCKMLGLNRDNSKLIDFICSEKGEEMLLIHIKTGNI